MKPSEIRGELLRQHAQIRIMMDVTLTIAKGARLGAPGRGDLQGCLVRLADALRTHNQREEALLRDIIPSVDAWGPARAAIMTEEQRTRSARRRASGYPVHASRVRSRGDRRAVDLIRQHMDREEAAFLGEDVLRDDIVVTNQSGG